jgi:V8-like Glu-specific endopeptidase
MGILSMSLDPDVRLLQQRYSLGELRKELRRRELSGRRELSACIAPDDEQLAKVSNDLIVDALLGQPRGIYGPDDRKDVYQIEDPVILERIKGVVLIAQDTDLIARPDGSYDLKVTPLGVQYNLCAGEVFAAQPTGGFCTGFFVTPDCIATAGHCVEGKNLDGLRFVVGFEMHGPADPALIFTADQIFKGVSVIRQQLDGSGDYAVVRVSNPTTQGVPLPVSRAATVTPNAAVSVIGHPSALPAKYAPNATVRDDTPFSYFVANLDTFGGNSGSPVFDAANEVVGILVRGDTDYIETSDGCNRVNVCPDSGCGGENVQRITGVFGAVHDMTLIVDIGDNGIWSGRKVYVKLSGADLYYHELPIGDADPDDHFEFQLSPAEYKIANIDDLTLIDVWSPIEPNPISWDSWTLRNIEILVNGGRFKYSRINVNYLFEDSTNAQEHWITIIPHC